MKEIKVIIKDEKNKYITGWLVVCPFCKNSRYFYGYLKKEDIYICNKCNKKFKVKKVKKK